MISEHLKGGYCDLGTQFQFYFILIILNFNFDSCIQWMDTLMNSTLILFCPKCLAFNQNLSDITRDKNNNS